jgi:hypothetical protein
VWNVVVTAGALPPLVELVELLRGGSDEGRMYAAGALGNLAIDNEAAVVGAGAIPPLVEMLRGASDEVRKHAGLALRKIMTINDASRAAVVAAGAIPLLPTPAGNLPDGGPLPPAGSSPGGFALPPLVEL